MPFKGLCTFAVFVHHFGHVLNGHLLHGYTFISHFKNPFGVGGKIYILK